MQFWCQEVEPNIWLVDKPLGVTSHDVVNEFRHRTGQKRVGHAGTLDPLATGLLIILVGREATKRQDEFMHQEKTYEVEVEFGKTTDTYDREGKVTSEKTWDEIQSLTELAVEKKMIQFRGEIVQTVPAYSAVKVGGHKLYDLARRGKAIAELPSRQVTIQEFTLVEFLKEETNQKIFAKFLVRCSSGTYIRSLLHDLGQALGLGATVTALRRVGIGKFSLLGREENG